MLVFNCFVNCMVPAWLLQGFRTKICKDVCILRLVKGATPPKVSAVLFEGPIRTLYKTDEGEIPPRLWRYPPNRTHTVRASARDRKEYKITNSRRGQGGVLISAYECHTYGQEGHLPSRLWGLHIHHSGVIY